MPQLTNITVGAFCRELVCGLEPIPDLLTSWGLSEADYKVLRKNEWFQRELRTAVAEVQELGADAAFITRCKILSELFLENVVAMMGNNLTPPEVKAGLFKQVTELARLHAPKQTSGPVSNAPLVTFTFGPGMPGVPEKLVIEAQPTATQLENTQEQT